MPETAPEDRSDSSLLPSRLATRDEQGQPPPPEKLEKPEVVSQLAAEAPALRRLVVNLFLGFLSVLAVATFTAVHISLLGGVISAVIGSGIVSGFPKFLVWALKPFEKEVEEIETEIRRHLGSQWLTRCLQGSIVALVLLNFFFLPQDAKSKLYTIFIRNRVIVRIVPVGNLHTALAALQGRDDAQFDLCVYHLDSKSEDHPYCLKKIGPGLIYTGAGEDDLRREHESRTSEITQLEEQLRPSPPASQAAKPVSEAAVLQRDIALTKDSWRKVQYLATDGFFKNERLAIEVHCVRLPGRQIKVATFTKVDAIRLQDPPLQTVLLNANLENNPCVPHH